VDDDAGTAPGDDGELLSALTAARLAADLLAAADVRCDRPGLDAPALVRALGRALERACAAAERLVAARRAAVRAEQEP